MEAKDNGGPAFPAGAFEPNQGGDMYWQEGMTLRDYFAAKAMQGLLASEGMLLTIVNGATENGLSPTLATAAFCYNQADAMLAAREAKND